MSTAEPIPDAKPPNRLPFILLAVAIVALAAVAFFVVKKPAAPTTQDKVVRLGSFFEAVDYAPFLVAKSKGWYEEELKPKGYTVEYTTFQSLPPINEALATGRIDGVVAAEPPIIVGNAAGISSKIVAISCSLTQEILVPMKSDINGPADLKGKRVAVLAGTSSHYGLFKIIEKAGLKQSDIEVIDMVPPDAKNAFETGKVDAWAVWPPFVEQEEIAGTGRILPKGDAQINSILAVRGSLVTENPDLVRELVQIHAKAKIWIIDHEAEATEIVAKQLNIPLEVAQKAWPEHNWKAQLTPEIVSDIQAKADFLFQAKFIRNAVDASKIVDPSFEQGK